LRHAVNFGGGFETRALGRAVGAAGDKRQSAIFIRGI
jgi:hypothetical protein